MKKNMKKALAGALSVTAMMAQPATAIAEEAPAAAASLDSRKEESFATIKNVQGKFSFRQDEVTPADDIFNLFGTVATAACAKPGFAMDQVAQEEYYVNVSGTIKKYGDTLYYTTQGSNKAIVSALTDKLSRARTDTAFPCRFSM